MRVWATLLLFLVGLNSFAFFKPNKTHAHDSKAVELSVSLNDCEDGGCADANCNCPCGDLNHGCKSCGSCHCLVTVASHSTVSHHLSGNASFLQGDTLPASIARSPSTPPPNV